MSERVAQQTLQLAHAAMNRGHHQSALDLATRVVAMEGDLPEAFGFDGQRRHRLVSAAIAMVVDAQIAHGRASVAVEFARRYWIGDPVDPPVAAAFVRALTVDSGADSPLSEFHLSLVQRADAALDDSAVPVCLTICRNEMQQLPSFLAHHRRLGVRRFIVVDNGSTDGTIDYSQTQPDVDLWTSDLSFRTLAFGANAFSAIAYAELRDRWLLLLDADERFVPPQPGEDLRTIVASLVADGMEAMPGALLDLYDDRPLLSPRDPVPADLEGVAFFDREWSHDFYPNAGPFSNGLHITGGVRRRVFGPSPVFLLSKVPLVRFTPGRLLVGGQHDSNASSRVRSTAHAAVLHTKFLAATERLGEEAVRGEYPNAASDYVAYSNTLTVVPDLSLYDPAMSIRYEGPAQLLALGIARL